MRHLRLAGSVLGFAVSAVALAQGCGTDTTGDLAPGDDGGTEGSSGSSSGFMTDDGGGSSGSSGSSGASGDGGCGDTSSDPKNCGKCGSACGTGQFCAKGMCACPPYEGFCGGKCIPTAADAKNCGACGTTCTGTDACSAGVCSSSCLPGLTACSNVCVDTQNDNANCGGCGKPCGAGTGCAGGNCVTAVTVSGAPAACAGGAGPPIVIGSKPNDCLGGLASTTFQWSLLSCTDLDVSAPLSTDAYDSTMGPYKPGGVGGGVGVDRDVTHWSQAVSVGGTLWVSGTGDYQSSGPASHVADEMHLGGSWAASSAFTVGKDAFVVGTLSGVTVSGTSKKVASVPQAADCSTPALVPVANIVAAHRAPNNDDATIGLVPTVFESPGGPLRLDLPCGNYYLTKIVTSNPLTIAAHGNTALYIDGIVNPSAPIAFVNDPTGSFDVFIADTFVSSQTVVIGSPNYPALNRTYIGGTESLKFSQDVRIAGEIWAGNSSLVDWSANNEIYGSVFAGNFKSSQNTIIHYDRGVLDAGKTCPPPSSTGGGDGGASSSSSSGGSSGAPACTSCRDCGNQACIANMCGADCTDSSQCCAPLVCVGGVCRPEVN